MRWQASASEHRAWSRVALAVCLLVWCVSSLSRQTATRSGRLTKLIACAGQAMKRESVKLKHKTLETSHLTEMKACPASTNMLLGVQVYHLV